MSAVPVVTVTKNQAEYNQGDAVVLTFSVPPDTRDQTSTRTIQFTGQDGEGNVVSGSLEVVTHQQVPDTFTLTSVKWADTNQPFTINGMTATSTA